MMNDDGIIIYEDCYLYIPERYDIRKLCLVICVFINEKVYEVIMEGYNNLNTVFEYLIVLGYSFKIN